MQKKLLVFVASLTLIGAISLVSVRSANAACECLKDAYLPYPTACSYADPAKLPYDSTGEKIPQEACGVWRSTPFTVAGAGQQPDYANAEEPVCAVSGEAYGSGKKSAPFREHACNIYTQTYFRTPFRVPTLGDLLGNVVRLFFFIAGIYAMLLLLLGGFEWVSSGGDEKKLTSARGKILNAVIGLIVMVAVLTLVIVLEQVVFAGKVCLGISCPINLSGLQIVGR